MAFGKKTAAPSAESTPSPSPSAPSAQERLAALFAEQAELESAIASHREQRRQWLSDGGPLERISQLGMDDDRLRLRLEQIAAQLPGVQRELAQEQREKWEAAWATHERVLAAAQDRLAAAITEFHAALHAVHVAHVAARWGGTRLDAFIRPFPEESYNRYATTAYVQAVERRRHPPSLPAVPEVWLDPLPDLPAEKRFVPRRVPYDLVEQISPIAPMRRVRLLHTVRSDNLNIGHARLREGEEMMLPARAAFVLTYAGVGIYTDTETVEAATAA